MITDPQRIKLSDKGHPDICNVFSYFSTFASAGKPAEVRKWCEEAKVGCTECKSRLAAIIADYLEPIRTKRAKLSDSDVMDIIKDGARRAREAAGETMEEVRRLINFVGAV